MSALKYGSMNATRAATAGLAGIAVEAERVMIVDRAETIRRAGAAGLFIHAFALQAPAA